MHEAEGINFKIVHLANDPHAEGRRPSNLRPWNLRKMHKHIDATVTDPEVAEEVKRLAGGYPQQALWAFKKNLSSHIAKAQRNIRERNK